MATCAVCEKDMGFADRMNAKSFEGKWRDCSNEERIINQMLAAGIDPAEIERKAQLEQLEADQRMEIDAEIDAILITTETHDMLLKFLICFWLTNCSTLWTGREKAEQKCKQRGNMQMS